MKKKNITSVILVLIGLAATIYSFNSAPANDRTFKNLKVLPKDISKDKLDSFMDYYCISLNVHCGTCHARWADSTKRGLDFQSDANPNKNRARDMMRMTTFLNNTYFNEANSMKPDTLKTVTCFTCHRGDAHPTNINLMPQFNTVKDSRKKK